MPEGLLTYAATSTVRRGRATAPSTSSSTLLQPPIQTHVIEPYSSDIEAMTPGTRRKLLEHSVYKANDLKESEAEVTDLESEPPGSKHSSKPTTPRLSLKFNRGDKTRDPTKFDFGKSKITSKNEVVRKGKDVEVKIESLKLSKEDTLKLWSCNPQKQRQTKPQKVGTHKVLVFVNNQFPHPQTPFPIRVYDANQIIVGEIARESVINDTVEFTVDADSDGCIIPSHVSQLEAGTAKFLVTFNPTSLGTHTVNITFNKEIINGSPFEVNIVQDAASLAGKSAYSGKNNGSADYSTSTLESKKKDKVKETKQKKEKAERNGSKGKGDMDYKAALVTKIPSLSRVGKPAELMLSIPSTAVDRLIEARVTDPEKNELPVEIFEDEPNIRRIQFTSQRVGDHEIEVKLDGVEVEGSPFTCRSYDPAKIFVGNVPDGIVNKAVHFTVDASAAGVGNLEVAVNEGKIPSMAHALGQHKYDISFVPRENIDHQISVRFNNEPVPGSPFLSRLISNPSRPILTTSGPGLERISVGEPTEFWVNVQLQDASLPISSPKVQIVDARGDHIIPKISPDIQEPGSTRYLVVYTPKHVEITRLICARLSLLEKAHVGKPCTFTIDAAKAGAGNMEIIVSVGKRNVPNFVQAEGQAKFKVSFTPQEASEHVISVKFNGIPIPGSPMSCPVAGADVSSSSLPKSMASPYSKEEELERISPERGDDVLRLVGDLAAAQVGKTKRFSIDAPDRAAGKTDCNVVVTGPDKLHIPVRVIKVTEGFDVEFEVPRAGNYEIDIFINKKLLDVCPIICRAISLHSARLMEKSQELGCGESFSFDVDLPKLKRSEEIRVEMQTEDGKLINSTTKLDYNNHKAKVTFRTDEKPSTYFVTILRNESVLEERVFHSTTTQQNMQTTPSSRAAQEEVRLVHFPRKALVEHTAQFELELLDRRSAGELRVQIYDSDGGQREIPTSHYVDVLDLSAVSVIGLRNDCVGVQQNFKLDWSQSGGSSAAVSVIHESGQPIKCHMKEGGRDGLYLCSFTPLIPGLYLLTIFVDDMQLPECPYECVVSYQGAVRAMGDAFQRAQRGKTARFEVSLGNSGNRGELDVVVTDSHKSPLPVRCYKQHDDSYWAEFTPEQCGTHKIEVTFADIPSMDLLSTVRWSIPEECGSISVDRKHAGNGELSFELTDPSGRKLKTDQVKTSTGADNFTFLPVKLGPQAGGQAGWICCSRISISIDYCVERNSRLPSYSIQRRRRGMKIDVRGPSTKKSGTRLTIDQTALLKSRSDPQNYRQSFNVDVVDPVKVVVNDENLRPDGMLQLFFEERNVIDVDATAAGPGKLRAEVDVQGYSSAAELIEVDSRTLKLGIIGEDVKTVIDARKAGPGHLSAQWDLCSESNPKELGKHTLTIKYANEHIPGSPFSFTVSNPPDPSQVKVYGSGVSMLQIQFRGGNKGSWRWSVDCKSARTKRAFNVEMQRDRHQDRTIHCKYEPKEPGDYSIEVKWHGKHVPGSPFLVIITDTEQELQRFLSGNAPSPQPPTPFVPPGWMGHPGIPPPHPQSPIPFGPAMAQGPYGPIPCLHPLQSQF
uniref:Uncharacterized protein n=1 Tax=Ditylenchus dipsaci TaxID=166011 RepID=A0A915CNM7_9BILA